MGWGSLGRKVLLACLSAALVLGAFPTLAGAEEADPPAATTSSTAPPPVAPVLTSVPLPSQPHFTITDDPPPEPTIAHPTNGEALVPNASGDVSFEGSASDDNGVAGVSLVVLDTFTGFEWDWDAGEWDDGFVPADLVAALSVSGDAVLDSPGASSTDWQRDWPADDAAVDGGSGDYQLHAVTHDDSSQDSPVALREFTIGAPVDDPPDAPTIEHPSASEALELRAPAFADVRFNGTAHDDNGVQTIVAVVTDDGFGRIGCTWDWANNVWVSCPFAEVLRAGARLGKSVPWGAVVLTPETAHEFAPDDPGVTDSDWHVDWPAVAALSGGGSGSYTVTVYVVDDVAQTGPGAFAAFTIASPDLTVTKDGTGDGTVTSSPAGIDCGADCSETYAAGTEVTLTATPDPSSTFTGWSGDCTGTGTCVVAVNGPRAVTATFMLNSFVLTVESIGGSVSSNPAGIDCGLDCTESYPSGTVVTLTAAPDLGFSFSGWIGEACSDTGTCVVTMDATRSVTATYATTLSVVTAGAGTGTVTSSPAGINCGVDCLETYTSGTEVALTATPNASSTFAGWSGGGCSGTGDCVVTLNALTEVTATFTLGLSVLTVAKTGTGVGTVTSSPAGITCGADCAEGYASGTVVTLTAAPNASSTFAGWSGGGCSGTGTCVVTMNAATSVTATFTLIMFVLSVTSSGGSVSSSPAGITCGVDCTESYTPGTSVTLTMFPTAGFSFVGWSGACAGFGACVVTMNAAKSVTATFSTSLTVVKAGGGTGTVTSSPAGISCGVGCTQSYASGTVVTLTAAPNASSTFGGWSGGGCSGTGTCVVTMNAVTEVTATFTLTTFLLTVAKGGTGAGTVTSSPAGIACGVDCTEAYASGTVVTLTAAPNASSTFGGWGGGGCSGTATCVVTMSAAKSVTATFTLAAFGLTVAKSGTGSGTVTSSPAGINCGVDCAEIYALGLVVTLTAAPNASSTFGGWGGGGCSGTATCVVTMSAAKSVTATFTLATFGLTVAKSGTGSGTVTSSPAGITCGVDCTELHASGAVVTLTAAPNASSTFAGWSGACTGTGACVVTMSVARSATATFTAATTASPPVNPPPGVALEQFGTWIGAVQGTFVTVAIVSDGKRVWAHASDGAGISQWFEATLVGNSFTATLSDGSTINGAFDDGAVKGTFRSSDGKTAGIYRAVRPTRLGGVFRSEFDTSDGSHVIVRWIVDDDGTQRGTIETTKGGKTTTTTAPKLDVGAARVQGTAQLGLAGGVVPVIELTPAALGTVPTARGALKPLVVTASANPAKSDVGQPVKYRLQFTNPNSTALTGGAVRVVFPPAFALQPTTLTKTCSSTGAYAAFPPGITKPGDPQLIVSGVALGADASCIVSVDVVATSEIAVDVATEAPTADGTPPGTPSKVTIIFGASAATAATPTTTTTQPPATTTTTAPRTTTTAPRTTTTAPRTTTTAPRTTTTAPRTTTTAPRTTTTAPRTTTTAPRTTTTAPRTTTTNRFESPTTTSPRGATTTTRPRGPTTTTLPFGAGTTTPTRTPTTNPNPDNVRILVDLASGSSPLPVTFTLENAPSVLENWQFDFGEGRESAPPSNEAFPAAGFPHTFVNDTTHRATMPVTFSYGPESDRRLVRTTVYVHPEGTILVLGGSPRPSTMRRGAQGKVGYVDVLVRNPNIARVAGPITLSVDPSFGVHWVGSEWTCDDTSGVCTLAAGLESFAAAPTLEAHLDAPADALEPFQVPFEVTTASMPKPVESTTTIRLIGAFAKAGPDQSVDASMPGPDGVLHPTQVLLDASETLGLDGHTQTFAWEQVSGTPVTVDTSVDTTQRRVVFEAPDVTGPTPLVFELAVTDGDAVTRDRVTVTVFPRNQTPIISRVKVEGLNVTRNASGAFVPAGQGNLSGRVEATDPDGDTLTTSWRVLTPGVTDQTTPQLSLPWPIEGKPQVIVEVTVKDPRGAKDTETVTIGEPPPPLNLEVTGSTRVTSGQQASFNATPSRVAGVTINWGHVSGPTIPGNILPKSGRNIEFPTPDVDSPQVLVLKATATETATGATVTLELAIDVQPPPPLAVSVPPAVAFGQQSQPSIEATVTGPANRTLQWTQTLGPTVSLTGATTKTVSFPAGNSPKVIGLRLTVTANGDSVSADTIVTIGPPPALPTIGCGAGSAFARFINANGAPVVLGSVAVLSGFTIDGAAGADCAQVTLSGLDVNLLNGLVTGDNLGARLSTSEVCVTDGTVHLPSAFQLPPIDLSGADLCLGFANLGNPPTGGGGGGGGACAVPISWSVELSTDDFPFVPLPAGFANAGASLDISCTGASLSANATLGTATFAIDADLTTDGGAVAHATLTNVPVLGGAASGEGEITIAPGGAVTYDLSVSVVNPRSPLPGVTVNTATAQLTPAGLTVSAVGSLGQGSGSLAVTLEGALTETGVSFAVEASNTAPWQVGPGLVLDDFDLIGTLAINDAGAVLADLRVSVGGDWEPVPGLRVRQLALRIANTTIPPGCGIPAGGLWVQVTGQGRLEIPGITPIDLGIQTCLGLPGGAAQPAFSLTSTASAPQWAVAPGVLIRGVGIQVTFVDGTLTLRAFGSATLLGLDLDAQVVFFVPEGGTATVVVDASGSLASLGIPMPRGHIVFASADVDDFALFPEGVTIDLEQGITGIGTIDIGQAMADLLNDIFNPPTPILPRITVSVSFGDAIEIKAAISLGADGATLFMGCANQATTACVPTAPTTTRLALTEAFIRIVVGGAGGFQLGFGAEGTLNLPPAEAGGAASPLNLHVEASIQPPARVGLAMYFTGAWHGALGFAPNAANNDDGLTLSNLGIQGSIDFSTTPIPLVTMGITGQVDTLPKKLANVLGYTNTESSRFTLNVDPLAPILDLSLGVEGGPGDGIVMRPLTAVGQANALQVDYASLVIAPLGGTVGGVRYDPGVSVGFAANIFDVDVAAKLRVDILAGHLSGDVRLGTLTIGGVTFEDSRVLLDVTPTSFRQTLCGGVHIGDLALQGTIDVQAGAGPPGPAECGGVALEASGNPTGLQARFRLHAAEVPIGGVTVHEFTVDATAQLDLLSASLSGQVAVSAELDAMGNDLDASGTVAFGADGIEELHLRVWGNVEVGPVEITGTGRCPFAVSRAGHTTGACVVLDYAPETETPFRFGLKGKLEAAGSTATVEGSFDDTQASLEGSLDVPDMGSLEILGTIVYGASAGRTPGPRIADASGAMVPASIGDWRVAGRFGTDEGLAGGVAARWDFAAGHVTNALYVRGSASVALGGAASVLLVGSFTHDDTGLHYSLHGESTAAVPESFIKFEEDAVHGALRALVFAIPGARSSDQRFFGFIPERTKGKLLFGGGYRVSATLTEAGLNLEELNVTAHLKFGEMFRRYDEDGNPDPDGDTAPDGTGQFFNLEPVGRQNTLLEFDLRIQGATRTQPAELCFIIFNTEYGDSC